MSQHFFLKSKAKESTEKTAKAQRASPFVSFVSYNQTRPYGTVPVPPEWLFIG
jgi:hypothetical protein